jgi:hypothetical protein
MSAMSLTRGEYVAACLAAIGSPATVEHRVALESWIVQEWSEATDQGPTDNALDLTDYEPGAVPFNAFGPGYQYHVWNYPSLAEGAQAFHDILQGVQYTALLGLLRSPNSTAEQLTAARNATSWGYCNPALVLFARANLAFLEALIVPGAGPVPPPPTVEVDMVYTRSPNFLVRGDKKAGIPTPDALAAIVAQGIPEKKLTAAELDALTTVRWGQL